MSLVVWICVWTITGLLALESAAQGSPLVRTASREITFEPLVARLIADGFEPDYIVSVLHDTRARFLPDILDTNLFSIYRKDDYSHFTSKTAVITARAFLKQETSFLMEVENQFQIEKEIIVSILFIESCFGKQMGTHAVLNVFATLARGNAPDVVDNAFARISKRYPHVVRSAIEQRAHKKSEWAYRELMCLLRITQHHGYDPFAITGSWAGAFGMPQFLPSSYERFGLDGNKDGIVNLEDRHDAAISVAYYLQHHGWQRQSSLSQKKEVLRSYNNSAAYADTVLQLAHLIKTP